MFPELSPVVRSRHYQHAPIAEAIIDIRCELPPSATLEDVARVVNDPAFSQRDNSLQFQQQFEVKDSSVISSEGSGRQIGYVFRREDGQRVIHPRLDGFGFSWTGPYETWEKFVAEAEVHWLSYRDAVEPIRATRLGVRYVNKIDIPSLPVEIKDYLRITADVPAYLPQAVVSYFMQVGVPLRMFDCIATITSAVLPPSDEGTTSLLLDIDTYHESDIDLSRGSEAPGVAERLDTLRHAKNYVFESCITDATRGLIR